MPRTMYDSIAPSAIPRDAKMVGGYVDGIFAWSQADWDRFPNAVRVTISAIGARSAQVVDVEPGCVWPVANAVPWVVKARKEGYDPTVYCNSSHKGAVQDAFRAAGVAEPHFWVAYWDNEPDFDFAGTIAEQYKAPESGSPGHYDISTVADFWPGVDGPGSSGGGGARQDDLLKDEVVYRGPGRGWGSAADTLTSAEAQATETNKKLDQITGLLNEFLELQKITAFGQKEEWTLKQMFQNTQSAENRNTELLEKLLAEFKKRGK